MLKGGNSFGKPETGRKSRNEQKQGPGAGVESPFLIIPGYSCYSREAKKGGLPSVNPRPKVHICQPGGVLYRGVHARVVSVPGMYTAGYTYNRVQGGHIYRVYREGIYTRVYREPPLDFKAGFSLFSLLS